MCAKLELTFFIIKAHFTKCRKNQCKPIFNCKRQTSWTLFRSRVRWMSRLKKLIHLSYRSFKKSIRKHVQSLIHLLFAISHQTAATFKKIFIKICFLCAIKVVKFAHLIFLQQKLALKSTFNDLALEIRNVRC